MQAGHFQQGGSSREAVATILSREGPSGFYTGFLSTIVREVRRRRKWVGGGRW